MSMSWRLMGNLQVIKDDIKRNFRPIPTIYTVGDEAHRTRLSDHNPVDYGYGAVVAAIDVMLPPSAANLRRGHTLVRACLKRVDLAYVIYNGQIWSMRDDWKPRAYGGPNSHRDHVHISSRHDRKSDLVRAHLIFIKTPV